MTQKIVLKQVVHRQPVPGSEHKIHWILSKGPNGLCLNHFLGLPNNGRCCPKRKKNYPLPRNNVGSGDPIPLVLPLPCGAKGVVSGSSVQTRRVLGVRGWRNQPSVMSFPLPGVILTF